MTYKEASKDLKYTIHESNCGNVNVFPNIEALEIAVEAIEKVDEYKWHDLRENPEDLPEVGKPFVYAFYPRESKEYGILYNVSMGFEGNVECIKHQSNEYAEYIAWKYFELEPFKEM